MTTLSDNSVTSMDHIKTIFNPATCIRRGHCEVAGDPVRLVQPHLIYYEMHGSKRSDAEKVLLIMGLNNSSFAWSKQVEYFTTHSDYTVLCFDNRGVGNSGLAAGRFYKTSEMAQDAVELLAHVGWEESIHVNGISMGGMIALELALLIPERINTLILTSTKSGNPISNSISDVSASSMKALGRIKMFSTLLFLGPFRSPEFSIGLIIDGLFPQDYLNLVDKSGKTKRETVTADFMTRVEVGKPQTFAGRVGQLAAVLTHRVAPEQLAKIAQSIPKISIIHGDQDFLIDHHHATELHENLKGSEYQLVVGGGHALPHQIYDEYNAFVVRSIKEGRAARDARTRGAAKATATS